MINMPKQYKNNKSGYKGVSWCKTSGKWKAQITYHGKVLYLGVYPTPEEAHEVYLEFIKEHNEESRLKEGMGFNECRQLWASKNKERSLAIKKKYRDNNKDKMATYAQERGKQLKQDIVDAYGGKCECCGEDNIKFLTIDHINNDGKAHRQEINGNTYFWLKKNNYPKDNFRLLCYNCNIGRAKNGGICPHEEERNAKKKEV